MMMMIMIMVLTKMRTNMRKKKRKRRKRKMKRSSTLRTSSRKSYQYSCSSGEERQRSLLTCLRLKISAIRTKMRVSFLKASDKQSSSSKTEQTLMITNQLSRKPVQREKSLITSKLKLEMRLNSIGGLAPSSLKVRLRLMRQAKLSRSWQMLI